MEVRQTKKALIVRGVLLWWWWMITLGIAFIWDFVSFRRNRLVATEKTIRVETGVISISARDIPYGKIQSITVNQGALGQVFGYGHIQISSANELAPITFRYVDNPQAIRQALQDKIA
jgi:membrane protein YdbS with pleckstrin-like domain